MSRVYHEMERGINSGCTFEKGVAIFCGVVRSIVVRGLSLTSAALKHAMIGCVLVDLNHNGSDDPAEDRYPFLEGTA